MGIPSCGQRLLRWQYRWRFDSSNARELWTVMQQRIFY